jgi:archaeosine synthase beta-subunit
MSARLPSIYPVTGAERDRWILERRPPRAALDPWRPYAFSVENECSDSGEVVPVATVFLTNRECPWHCLMCDLWRNTLTEEAPKGAIPAQIGYALARLPAARQVKLYNSGSFFDTHAIPFDDYTEIADKVKQFQRVIVESHPALIGDRCLQFRDLLSGRLEVAMGLETADPETLFRLNKRMTLDQFGAAAKRLLDNDIPLRVFVLVKPPFTSEAEALQWAKRSIDAAFNCGASVVSLIPTRAGNGAMDELVHQGDFSSPRIGTVEAAANYGVSLKRGRVFVDLWDLRLEPSCSVCYMARVSRLGEMNLRQSVLPPVRCRRCGAPVD